jgi:hypothetical protein
MSLLSWLLLIQSLRLLLILLLLLDRSQVLLGAFHDDARGGVQAVSVPTLVLLHLRQLGRQVVVPLGVVLGHLVLVVAVDLEVFFHVVEDTLVAVVLAALNHVAAVCGAAGLGLARIVGVLSAGAVEVVVDLLVVGGDVPG